MRPAARTTAAPPSSGLRACPRMLNVIGSQGEVGSVANAGSLATASGGPPSPDRNVKVTTGALTGNAGHAHAPGWIV